VSVTYAGLIGGVDDVTEECNGGTETGGHAIQGADNGLLYPQHIVQQSAAT